MANINKAQNMRPALSDVIDYINNLTMPDTSALSTQISTNTSNITKNTNNISSINTTLSSIQTKLDKCYNALFTTMDKTVS